MPATKQKPEEKNERYESMIHVYRAMHRMTQGELAEKVGCSRQTIIQIERNRFNPSLLMAHDIAKYFGVTIEQIIIFKDSNKEGVE